jgi:hypothetical protein
MDILYPLALAFCGIVIGIDAAISVVNWLDKPRHDRADELAYGDWPTVPNDRDWLAGFHADGGAL